MAEHPDDLLFDDWEQVGRDPVPLTPADVADGKKPSEAKRSIRYMAEMALRYGKVGGLADLLDRVAAFRQYSPYNALLVLLQRPAATYVLPGHAWEERYGRVVRPNEQPLVMLQFQGPLMFVFDVSQTEEGSAALPLPAELTSPYEMRDSPEAGFALSNIIEIAKLDGVRVLDAPLGTGFAGCAQRSLAAISQEARAPRKSDGQIAVNVHFEVLLNRAYSSTEQLAALAHELGHIYCGHLGEQASEVWPAETFWRDRRHLSKQWQELEAESVARVVFRRLDPTNPLPDHLGQFFAQEPELTGVDLEPILTSAGRVLEMADGKAARRVRSRGSNH